MVETNRDYIGDYYKHGVSYSINYFLCIHAPFCPWYMAQFGEVWLFILPSWIHLQN